MFHDVSWCFMMFLNLLIPGIFKRPIRHPRHVEVVGSFNRETNEMDLTDPKLLQEVPLKIAAEDPNFSGFWCRITISSPFSQSFPELKTERSSRVAMLRAILAYVGQSWRKREKRSWNMLESQESCCLSDVPSDFLDRFVWFLMSLGRAMKWCCLDGSSLRTPAKGKHEVVATPGSGLEIELTLVNCQRLFSPLYCYGMLWA